MVRIAYFGTDGHPGHHVIPIRGKFTEEDIKVIESVDCDDFYKVFDVMRFKIAEFKGWTIDMRCHLGAGRQEASLSAHQYTIRNRVLWIETPLYTISTCGIRYSP